METKTYSGKKIASIVVLGTAVFVASATSATALSMKSAEKNVIPAVSTVCANVADKQVTQQPWAEAFGQCVETLGIQMATY